MNSPEPEDLRFRDAALADGFSDAELARLTRGRQWSRVRRGAYLRGPLPQERMARYMLVVHATVRALRRPAVVSHQSAAVLHGLELWNVRLDKVHITRHPPASSDARGLRCHVARLREDEVTEVAGLQVTSLTRTVLDLARSQPFESAVVAADAALHRRLVDHEQLRQRLFDLAGTPGSRAAARVVAFADGRSESVGESRSRVILHKVGIARPTLQLPLTSATGVFLGRADFGWERYRVIGEFDGRIKYGRLLRPGQDPGDAVFEEKRREDSVREENWGVVRWVWDELAAPVTLGRRVQRALERGPGLRR